MAFIEVAQASGYFMRSEFLSRLGNTPQTDIINIERELEELNTESWLAMSWTKKVAGKPKGIDCGMRILRLIIEGHISKLLA